MTNRAKQIAGMTVVVLSVSGAIAGLVVGAVADDAPEAEAVVEAAPPASRQEELESTLDVRMVWVLKTDRGKLVRELPQADYPLEVGEIRVIETAVIRQIVNENEALVAVPVPDGADFSFWARGWSTEDLVDGASIELGNIHCLETKTYTDTDGADSTVVVVVPFPLEALIELGELQTKDAQATVVLDRITTALEAGRTEGREEKLRWLIDRIAGTRSEVRANELLATYFPQPESE